MENPQRNFARKWRPVHFDTIVGQELVVRMLKNSLYLNQLFPVYLFSGQRGCGKTTTARIFAAAINCHALQSFRANPKISKIPCLSCDSCVAMAQGQHPDFIEIDAASHTGVDNVRMIIDAASLLPVMGNKKIYLIDEAHMLSKAAFNAFLKILEEPPVSVVFMLATTDPEKIIETVRSRCFQLFFTGLPLHLLVEHLKTICEKEKIEYEETALYVIARETQGSARDALNVLEQVRFGAGAVTQDAVLRLLGHMAEDQLLTLFEHIIRKDIQGCMQFLQDIQFETFSAVTVWNSFASLVRAALFAVYGVSDTSAFQWQSKERFIRCVQNCSVQHIHYYLQKIYDCEMQLLKSTTQHGILELLFLECASFGNNNVTTVLNVHADLLAQKIETIPKSNENNAVVQEQKESEKVVFVDGSWKKFMGMIEEMTDPLVLSIFKQATFKEYCKNTKQVTVAFAQEATLFGDWLKDTQPLWQKALHAVWESDTQLLPLFEGSTKTVSQVKIIKENTIQKTMAVAQSNKQPQVKEQVVTKKTYQKGAVTKTVSLESSIITKPIVITDKETWKTANELVNLFGGTVEEVLEDEKIA